TYLDSPFHRYPDGRDLSALDLESLANLEGVVVRHVRSAERALELDLFKDGPDNQEALNSSLIEVDSPIVSERAITSAWIEHLDVAGKAVLFHTGWDMRWRTEDYADGNHPFLTAGAAEYLAREGA